MHKTFITCDSSNMKEDENMVDVKILALANLAVQILLVITVSCAAYLAKKRKHIRHCNFMKVLVLTIIIPINYTN